MEKLIGILLRECADNFDERVTRVSLHLGNLLSHSAAFFIRFHTPQDLEEALRSTQLFWNYGFFERLIKTLLKRMGLFNADPEAPGPQTSPKAQMAVACEVKTFARAR